MVADKSNARNSGTAPILAGPNSTCLRLDIDPEIHLTQLLVNLPVLRISGLPDWLPDRWKTAQKIRLAALRRKTPLS